jgi:DNA-binding response OmpR family regulator
MPDRHTVAAPVNFSLVGRRILLVEDEMMVMFMMEDNLSALGCTEITSVANVEQANSVIDDNHFDAAILDLNLNGETSEPVAQALTEKCVPFFFCTGHGESKVNGFPNSVLRKPFSSAQLAIALGDLLS